MMKNMKVNKTINVASINPEICKCCPYKWQFNVINNSIKSMFCVNENRLNSLGNPDMIVSIYIENYNQFQMDEHNFLHSAIKRKSIYEHQNYCLYVLKPENITASLKEACKNIFITQEDQCPYFIEHQISGYNNKWI